MITSHKSGRWSWLNICRYTTLEISGKWNDSCIQMRTAEHDWTEISFHLNSEISQIIYIYYMLVGGLEPWNFMNLWLSIQLGISSSQLTHIVQRGVPPTSMLYYMWYNPPFWDKAGWSTGDPRLVRQKMKVQRHESLNGLSWTILMNNIIS